MKLVYEGKAKRMYDLGDRYLMEFKDEVTAGDGAKRDKAPGKGALAAQLSALLFSYLSSRGIPHHFIEAAGPTSLVVKKASVIPVEVIVRFKAYGSYLKRMPAVRPLAEFKRPLVEFHLKDDKLHDPLVLEEDIIEAGLAEPQEVETTKRLALAAASALRDLYGRANCDFVDVKFEFGRRDGLILVDEISGDTFRLLCDGEHLDKEYYRKTGDVAGLLKRYERLLELTKTLLS
ncbi:MAG: phosphoribosylaminoimidazolesuccinocarboxamide synthase [Thermoproteus sp.]